MTTVTTKWLRTRAQRRVLSISVVVLLVETIICMCGGWRGVLTTDICAGAIFILFYTAYRVGLWIELGDEE